MTAATEHFSLASIPAPTIYPDVASIALDGATMRQRLEKVRQAMQQASIDSLIIYADKEHGANFEYLSGFIPRFEEALLVVTAQGKLTYIMGNENLKLVPHARNGGQCLHAAIFSLPNQPMAQAKPLSALLESAGVEPEQTVGVAGWKLFTSPIEDNCHLFDVPAFIMDAIYRAAGGKDRVINGTGLFISPDNGARCRNSANEIASYEYGANLASSRVLIALDSIALDKSEKQVGQQLASAGQPNSVITIAATGDRFANASLYPSDKVISLGDKFSLTVGYKGGLTSRAAYVVNNEAELPDAVNDYLTRLAIPYYRAVVTWLESLRIGMHGGELYARIEKVLPKATYGWHLNPGHLTADEEWLSSPIYCGSEIALQSGMILQADIIPSLAGYGGCSIEDTVALGDEDLRNELREHYPEVWQRMTARKEYVSRVLNLHLSEDVLLLSNTVGYLRPYLLNKTSALVRQAS